MCKEQKSDFAPIEFAKKCCNKSELQSGKCLQNGWPAKTPLTARYNCYEK